MAKSKPPQVELPNKVEDIFENAEQYFGADATKIIKMLAENQRFLENMWELPKESFTFDGLLTSLTDTDSPRAKFRIGGSAVEFEATLRDAGSSDTHIDLYIDGNFVIRLIIPSGSDYASEEINWPVSRNSTFYVDVSQAGTDATGLVGYVHLNPNLRPGT